MLGVDAATSVDDTALVRAHLHRGPDQQGHVRLQTQTGLPLLLAATRLAILDARSDASQPMASVDGRLHLVFNGELYNFRALRADLARRGAQFRTQSDTEVLLEGYACLGAAFFSQLRGMFAFALWDAAHQTLLLVRDAIGIKPLYYHLSPGTPGRLVFASEARTLLAANAVPRHLDAQALTDYLSVGAVPEPNTLISGVRALSPGQVLVFSALPGGLQVTSQRLAPLQADESSPSPPPQTRAQAQSLLHAALLDSVSHHLESDVPVAVLLSGGVDSTSLAILAQRAASARHRNFLTLTLATDDPAPGEEQIAAHTAHALGLAHNTVRVTAEELALGTVGTWLAAADQPSLDGLNTFLIAAHVRKAGYKVALSGLGSDELFFGYGLHRRFARAYATRQLAARLSPFSGSSALSAADLAPLYQRQRRLFPQRLVTHLVTPSLRDRLSTPWLPVADLPPHSPRDPQTRAPAGRALFLQGLAIVQAFERSGYLLHTLLRDADTYSMAHGVELRVPFCDTVLWQRTAPLLPWLPLSRKEFLVATVDHPRLTELAALPKRGFVLPIAHWLDGPLSGPLSRLLSDDALVQAAGLHPPSIRWLLRAFQTTRYLGMQRLHHKLAQRLFALYVLLAYIDRHALRLPS